MESVFLTVVNPWLICPPNNKHIAKKINENFGFIKPGLKYHFKPG
jgi:hypothetical protein